MSDACYSTGVLLFFLSFFFFFLFFRSSWGSEVPQFGSLRPLQGKTDLETIKLLLYRRDKKTIPWPTVGTQRESCKKKWPN